MSRPVHKPLRVLVLGGSGHIGRRYLTLQDRAAPGAWQVQAVGASRHGQADAPAALRVDVCDRAQLQRALQGMDAVVNAVAGSPQAIAQGTQALCEAALPLGVRLVHLSTQSVYGGFEGWAHESLPLDPRLGWYGRAKCQAELQVRAFVRRGGQAVVLRPGCVWGPGSWLWAGRMAQWLQQGRLGDLGAAGDGWSNLVHVDDVCQAIHRCLNLPLQKDKLPVFNLAAPDSPRWNEVWRDMALALHITPVRLGARQLWLDSHVLSPPLKLAQRLWQRLGGNARRLPEPLPPGLLRLWTQQIRLDTTAATRVLGLRWTPYATGLAESVRWVTSSGHATAPWVEIAGHRLR